MEMDIKYDLSVGKNAELKYNKRDKLKSKIKGIDKAIEVTNKKIYNIENDIKKQSDNIKFEKIIKSKKLWYEKFRFFITTNNNLVVSGKDSRNNELLIKKYMEDQDLYFHADVFGAPHTLLKKTSKEFIEDEKIQAAIFAASFSSAWKNKQYSIDVYMTLPSQVTKTANTGESLSTGAFVIRGKRDYFRKLEPSLAIGFSEKYGIFSGPIDAIKKHCKIYYVIKPGNLKKSEVSKKLSELFALKKIKVSIDFLNAIIPPGTSDIIT